VPTLSVVQVKIWAIVNLKHSYYTSPIIFRNFPGDRLRLHIPKFH
jgi:hypothetical protein